MINSQIISNRQNEDLLLKIQYASRSYFNSAEKINYVSWGLCIASAVMIFDQIQHRNLSAWEYQYY